MKYIIIILLIAGFFIYSHKEDFKPRKNALSLQQDEAITQLEPYVEPEPKIKQEKESPKISAETQFQLDILERNEIVAKARLNALLQNPPVFQERKSTRGIRTSDADRKRIIEKRNQEISDLRIYLEKIKIEKSKIQNK